MDTVCFIPRMPLEVLQNPQGKHAQQEARDMQDLQRQQGRQGMLELSLSLLGQDYLVSNFSSSEL